jgi:hypothetical protein
MNVSCKHFSYTDVAIMIELVQCTSIPTRKVTIPVQCQFCCMRAITAMSGMLPMCGVKEYSMTDTEEPKEIQPNGTTYIATKTKTVHLENGSSISFRYDVPRYGATYVQPVLQ